MVQGAPPVGELLRRLRRTESSRRRLQVIIVLLCACLAGLAATAERPPADHGAQPVPRAAPARPSPPAGDSALFPPASDLTYENALRPFVDRPAERRALAAEIVTAARAQRVDPDLLFAVVAVESGFDPRAVSPRGARGLGQLLFGTAHAVAPHRVRQPQDLYEPARNLDATARLLHLLLVRNAGHLDRALRAYYGGPWDPAPRRPDRERYWLKVAARYAALKGLRAHRALTESRAPGAESQAAGAGSRAPEEEG